MSEFLFLCQPADGTAPPPPPIYPLSRRQITTAGLSAAEAEAVDAVEESNINVPGDDADDVVETTTSPVEPDNEPTGGAWPRHERKEKPVPSSDEDNLIQLEKELELLGTDDFCSNKQKGHKTKMKCGCSRGTAGRRRRRRFVPKHR